ncbi:unnamed protein product [Cylindrotheca closterium]|uniref:Uncharacterized protein n=1 Tax=Cylindrotheca closterium TaxID=2856 RepID=A0AAD2PV10_9STRA|nr:unnamed protein product [Cylindrotheca closterium]
MTPSPPNKSNQAQQQQQQESPLLLATSSNSTAAAGRTKSPAWTVADLFAEPPALGIFYHLCGTTYDLCTPVGTTIGAAIALPVFSKTRPFLQVAGTGGLIGGGLGLMLGAAAYTSVSQGFMPPKKGSLPWDEQGILERRDKIATNTMIRSLDAGTYIGILMGALAMGIAGGPAALSLRTGVLGVGQGLSLGATAGSLATIGYLSVQAKEDEVQTDKP